MAMAGHRSLRPLSRHLGASSRWTNSPGQTTVRSFSVSALSLVELKRTPLYDWHVSRSAKMVPFAGWSMPLSYGDIGQTVAHGHVRTSAGLFDVSHMLQHRFTGPGTQELLMTLCPSSLHSLPPWTGSLSVLLNETGGIIDDTIITKQASDEDFYVVTNAGRAEEDKALLQSKVDEWNAKHSDKQVKWETLDGWGLLALQGPKAAEVLQGMVQGKDLTELKFGQSCLAKVGKGGAECHIARGGYTGEDGFEISIPPQHTIGLAEELLASSDVMAIGLGARDSLRLEAGMCLYGHDLDESVSPVEAALSWVIGKDRRDPSSPFPGQSRILSELASAPARRRVGLEISGVPAREGCKIFSSSGTEEIGVITSGIPSPTLGTNIAMGYVKNGHHKKGTQVMVEVRKKMREAEIKPMPFVKPKYYK